jgi:hypothetical protein
MTDTHVDDPPAIRALKRRLARVEADRAGSEQAYERERDMWEATRPAYDDEIAELKAAIETLEA